MRKQGEFGYGALDESEQPFLAANSDEKQFQQLIEKTSSNIQRINSNVSSVERSVRQIGTPSDGINLRNRITAVLQEVNQYVVRTQTQIRSLKELRSGLSKENRLQEERITNQFIDTVQRVSTVQKKVAKQMKSYPDLPRQTSSTKTEQGEFGSEPFAAGMDAQMQKQAQDVEYDLNLLEERERQVRDIETAIVDVNEIFRDLSSIVMEQGDMIDSIEANVERGSENVEDARAELHKAEQYQKKARRKQCCIVVTLVVIVIIIAIILIIIIN